MTAPFDCLEFLLTNGRTIVMKRVTISETFLGTLQGLPDVSSRRIRNSWREKSELRGWQVIDPHGDVLPRYQCVASFESNKPTRVLEWDYSYLDVCWFTNCLDRNLRELFADILPELDWEQRALDGSWSDV